MSQGRKQPPVASAAHPANIGATLSQRKVARPAVNLAAKLSSFREHWAPRVVAEFNGHDVMVVKVKGEFRWHQHEGTDDFFLVGPSELFVVPKAVQHCPVAEEEAHLLLVEPVGTPDNGDRTTAAERRVI